MILQQLKSRVPRVARCFLPHYYWILITRQCPVTWQCQANADWLCTEDCVSAEAVRACSEAKRCVYVPGGDSLIRCKACQSYLFPILEEVGWSRVSVQRIQLVLRLQWAWTSELHPACWCSHADSICLGLVSPCLPAAGCGDQALGTRPSSTGQRVTLQLCCHAMREKPSFSLSFFTALIPGVSVKRCWAQIWSHLLAVLDVSILGMSFPFFFSFLTWLRSLSYLCSQCWQQAEQKGVRAAGLWDAGCCWRKETTSQGEARSTFPLPLPSHAQRYPNALQRGCPSKVRALSQPLFQKSWWTRMEAGSISSCLMPEISVFSLKSLCLSTEIQLESVDVQAGGAQGLYCLGTMSLLASVLALQVVRSGARLQEGWVWRR